MLKNMLMPADPVTAMETHEQDARAAVEAAEQALGGATFEAAGKPGDAEAAKRLQAAAAHLAGEQQRLATAQATLRAGRETGAVRAAKEAARQAEKALAKRWEIAEV